MLWFRKKTANEEPMDVDAEARRRAEKELNSFLHTGTGTPSLTEKAIQAREEELVKIGERCKENIGNLLGKEFADRAVIKFNGREFDSLKVEIDNLSFGYSHHPSGFSLRCYAQHGAFNVTSIEQLGKHL